MNNSQATEAGTVADNIIKQLSTPSNAIETDKTTVEVLDKAKPMDTPAPDKSSWENRFKGYKASADKTINELRRKVDSFEMLASDVENLKAENTKLKETAPTAPDEMLELFSQEEVNGFNKLLDTKVGSLTSEVTTLQGKLQERDARDEEVLVANRHQSIVNSVAQHVSNYAELDINPKFREFMNEPDSYGNIRVDLLTQATSTNPPDIGRIVGFYNEYNAKVEQEKTNVVKAKPTFTQQEFMQTPTSSASDSVQTEQTTGIVWNRATINKFYKDKATGIIPAKEAVKLEKEMYAALAGRR